LAEQVNDDFVRACGERARLTVRVNPRLTTREQVARELAAFEPVLGTLSPLALHLNGQVRDTPAWRQGRIEVQDEGSQLIAELVRPPRRSRVLDYCAGAGGKALAIASTAPKRCTVHIHDVRSRALAQAVKRADRAGVSLSRELPDKAQRVLVDAPCTGTGTLRRDPARRFRLSPEYLQEMVALQRVVLGAAADRVAPGGRLIYATCSVSPEENEGQLEWLRDTLDWPVVPIKEVLGRERAEGVGDGRVLRVGPATHGTDAFYAVILQRP
jgi:16S rRNA (cytosine967-C5)-methyltransferase